VSPGYGSAHKSAPNEAATPVDAETVAPFTVVDRSWPVVEKTKSSKKLNVCENPIDKRALKKLGESGDAVAVGVLVPLNEMDAVAEADGVDDCVGGGVAPGECVCVPVCDCDGVFVGVLDCDDVDEGVLVDVGVHVAVDDGVGFRHSVPGCAVFRLQLTLMVRPYAHAGELVTVACIELTVEHANVSVVCIAPVGVPHVPSTSPLVYVCDRKRRPERHVVSFTMFQP